MKKEIVRLNSERADEIFMTTMGMSILDQSIDAFMSYNKWIQCRSDALSAMMDIYNVEVITTNNTLTDIIFIPK